MCVDDRLQQRLAKMEQAAMVNFALTIENIFEKNLEETPCNFVMDAMDT
jgi:hypothetical protein